ncbi:MAG: T9SS type A sorting domain-containing protein [Bacteroidetes bacterium]|nr:T9SS type A sorting domain-containing protein [Bacteroidota bacterium]
MKKVLITFIAIIIFVAGQAQITVTLGSALLRNPGTDVHLPVSVKGLNGLAGGKGVTGLELHIGYINTSLVYDTTLNFCALTPVSQWFFGANGTEYSTNWIEPAGNKLNIPDNTVLFDIVYHYLGGATILTFDTARCLLLDSAFNIIPGVHYVNGQVTPSLGAGESRWNGTGPWITAANWSNGIPGDSTNAIIETGEATVSSSAVCKALTISQGTIINLSPGFSLTANRDYTNNGNMNLRSDATGSGSLIVRGAVSGSGVNKFDRYLDFSSGMPNLVSSPVTGATAGVFGSNTVEKYVESSSSWETQPSSSNLETGSGYRINGSAPATFSFQGMFNSGAATAGDLPYTAGSQVSSRGLNLLGNPYPSAIQWEQGNWGRTNLDYAVYVWEGYKFVSWNGSVGALKDGIIPAMQGFFVKSNAAGASLTIPADARLHSTMPFYKNSEAVSNVISMQLENNTDTNHYDEAFVHILDGSTAGYDGALDAWKLTGSSSYPQIYTQSANQDNLSINTQPEFVSVPVQFTVGTAGSYKIIFGGISSFSPSQPLFFEDKTTHTVINIRNSSDFGFSSDGTTETGRFVLHFQEVGMEEHDGTVFTVWSNGNTIHISPITGSFHADRVDIYNLSGQLVSSAANLELPGIVQQDNLTAGLYIIQIITTKGTYTRKLMVR